MANGTSAPYKNSSTGETQGTRHGRKLRVYDLLQNECRALEKEGVAVIPAGNMNIARTQTDGHPSLGTIPAQHCTKRAGFETRFFGSVPSGVLQIVDTLENYTLEDLTMRDILADHPWVLAAIEPSQLCCRTD